MDDNKLNKVPHIGGRKVRKNTIRQMRFVRAWGAEGMQTGYIYIVYLNYRLHNPTASGCRQLLVDDDTLTHYIRHLRDYRFHMKTGTHRH